MSIFKYLKFTFFNTPFLNHFLDSETIISCVEPAIIHLNRILLDPSLVSMSVARFSYSGDLRLAIAVKRFEKGKKKIIVSH